jgi:uncharacterized cupin superfamily protein
MKIDNLPFSTTEWINVAPTRHAGETGHALWHTRQFGDVRVRLVEYSPGYKADHWCQKGHFVLVLDGDLTTELADGRTVALKPGMSWQVADGDGAHRTSTATGAKLFIVD